MTIYNKISGGKLVGIKITIEKDKIVSFQLVGDFFLYPEDKITALEKVVLYSTKHTVKKRLTDCITKEHIVLFGVKKDDIVTLIYQAYET